MVWMHIVTTKRKYVTNISKNRNKIFSHVFTICLKCTLESVISYNLLEHSLQQRTRSQRRRDRSFCWAQTLPLCFRNCENLNNMQVRDANFFQNLGEVRTRNPNTKTNWSIRVLSFSFFWVFFSNWTCKFHQLPKHGYVLPTQHLLPETYRCSQIWPTSLSYGFIGVV